MAGKFSPAPDVQKIAQELIPEHHPHLIDVRIEYVFIGKIPNKGNKQVWGTMRKIGALPAYLAAPSEEQADGATSDFFCMTITQPIWEQLSHEDKVALVDHELCHAGVEEDEDGVKKLKTIPHDLEEFNSIVERHGLWRKDIELFADGVNKAKKKAK
jgi:hypothetical protein